MLAVLGGLSAFIALTFGIFLRYLIIRNAATLDYIDAAKVKRVSVYLHIAEAILLVVWLNWLMNVIGEHGSVSGSMFLAAAASIVALRIIRRRQTRRRQLWEK